MKCEIIRKNQESINQSMNEWEWLASLARRVVGWIVFFVWCGCCFSDCLFFVCGRTTINMKSWSPATEQQETKERELQVALFVYTLWILERQSNCRSCWKRMDMTKQALVCCLSTVQDMTTIITLAHRRIIFLSSRNICDCRQRTCDSNLWTIHGESKQKKIQPQHKESNVSCLLK